MRRGGEAQARAEGAAQIDVNGAQSYECSAQYERNGTGDEMRTEEVEMHADVRSPIRLIVRGIQYS